MKLTQREFQIIWQIIDGKSNKQIADALGLTLGTVKIYLSRAYLKNGVKNRTALVIKYLEEQQKVQQCA